MEVWQKSSTVYKIHTCLINDTDSKHLADNDDDDDEIAYFTVRWKTRASFVYRTKNVDNNDKDSKNRKQSH